MPGTGSQPSRGVFVGLATLDVVHYVDAAPAANAKVTARGQSVAAGGPATNAAVTFAALGGDAILVTALGAGAVGKIIRADAEACGVQVVDVTPNRTDEAPVSSITVLAATGERSVVSVDAGAQAVDAVPDLTAFINGADVVLVDGHHPLLAEAAARAAREAGVRLVLDAGRWRTVMATVLPMADEVICSADFRHPGTVDVESSAAAITAGGVATVLVTQGADPVQWWQGDRSGSVSPPTVAVVDTSGAGDVFHGAYCYLLATSSADITTRIAGASRLASLKASYPGTRTWLAHLAGG